MSTCIKCGKPATYNHPENLCDDCWYAWWFEGYNEEEKQEVIEELNKIKKEKDASDA